MFHSGRGKTTAVILSLFLVTAAGALVIWYKKQPISLRGAVLVDNSDPRKQLPVAGVEISATGSFGSLTTQTDPSGMFVLKLRKPIRRGHPITLHFRHPLYHPLDQNDYVGDQLYVIRLTPMNEQATPAVPGAQAQPVVKVSNVRVRYTVEAMTELNVGSAVKTFQIENRGNVPCKGQHPCSPDGKWKASLASGSLDAGPGNQFRNARASCIAGPCPFTRIESEDFTRAGQIITVSARDWSDTTTFLVEAEVFRTMATQAARWSYPVIFGDGLSFTLPATANSVSIEADLDGQTIIFPLGPSLLLSWATCDSGSQDRTRFYRCALKPGYRLN